MPTSSRESVRETFNISLLDQVDLTKVEIEGKYAGYPQHERRGAKAPRLLSKNIRG